MNRLKTDRELKNIAYRIATGQCLTKVLSYSEFQKVDIMKYVWEPMSDWPKKLLESHIAEIGDIVYRKLKELNDDRKKDRTINRR